jgi:hypothetical protein
MLPVFAQRRGLLCRRSRPLTINPGRRSPFPRPGGPHLAFVASPARPAAVRPSPARWLRTTQTGTKNGHHGLERVGSKTRPQGSLRSRPASRPQSGRIARLDSGSIPGRKGLHPLPAPTPSWDGFTGQRASSGRSNGLHSEVPVVFTRPSAPSVACRSGPDPA